jgi:acetyltransferase-like isoleucine patch superfamily enzyme
MIDLKGGVLLIMRFNDWVPPKIKDGIPTKYQWIVKHTKNFHLGFKTDIGAFSYINAQQGVVIEDYVQIGSHCSIYSVSTIDNKKGEVRLKRGCRIGTHSVIMPGVTVGEGSIIGAFSFVNHNVPDGVLAYGVPAKVVRVLHGDEIIETQQ